MIALCTTCHAPVVVFRATEDGTPYCFTSAPDDAIRVEELDDATTK